MALLVAATLWLVGLAPRLPARSHCEGAWTRTGCEAAAAREPEQLLFGRPLDLNRARAASLETLPGIGPARAAAIVAMRCASRFEAVEDLTRVHGIGPRTLSAVAPSLAVDSTAGVAGCADALPRP